MSEDDRTRLTVSVEIVIRCRDDGNEDLLESVRCRTRFYGGDVEDPQPLAEVLAQAVVKAVQYRDWLDDVVAFLIKAVQNHLEMELRSLDGRLLAASRDVLAESAADPNLHTLAVSGAPPNPGTPSTPPPTPA